MIKFLLKVSHNVNKNVHICVHAEVINWKGLLADGQMILNTIGY